MAHAEHCGEWHLSELARVRDGEELEVFEMAARAAMDERRHLIVLRTGKRARHAAGASARNLSRDRLAEGRVHCYLGEHRAGKRGVSRELAEVDEMGVRGRRDVVRMVVGEVRVHAGRADEHDGPRLQLKYPLTCRRSRGGHAKTYGLGGDPETTNRARELVAEHGPQTAQIGRVCSEYEDIDGGPRHGARMLHDWTRRERGVRTFERRRVVREREEQREHATGHFVIGVPRGRA